jgi:hypothetical protein
LEDREFDGAAAVDQDGLAGVQLADLVGVHPRAVGHVHAGLAGWAPGVQLPGLLGHPDGAGQLDEPVGVGELMQHQPATDGVQQPPLLPLIAKPLRGLGAEHHRDADVAEAFGQVDGLLGAALDGRELVQHQQHVIADPRLAVGGEVAEVLQHQPHGGVGVLPGGDGRDGQHGQVDVLQAPAAVGLAGQGAE